MVELIQIEQATIKLIAEDETTIEQFTDKISDQVLIVKVSNIIQNKNSSGYHRFLTAVSLKGES